MYSVSRTSHGYTTSVVIVALCASASAVAEVRETVSPQVGIERSAAVGSIVYERVRSTVQPGVRIKSDAVKRTITGSIRLEAWAPLIVMSSRAKLKACVYLGPCGLDDDGDGKFDRIALHDAAIALKLDQPAPYEKISIQTPSEQDRQERMTLERVSDGRAVFRYTQRRGGSDEEVAAENYTVPLSSFPQSVEIRDIRFAITGVQSRGLTLAVN